MRKTAILLTLVALLLTGCRYQNSVANEKYKDYICYDYHLACLNVQKQKVQIKLPNGSTSCNVVVQKPVGESDTQFICTRVTTTIIFPYPKFVIMQNPDDYVNVFGEWTVKQMDIFLGNDVEGFARPQQIVLATSTDKTIISELIEFVENSDYSDTPVSAQGEKYNGYCEYDLYIRLHFNESENIVWDARVWPFILDESGQRIIEIDKGKEIYDVASAKREFAPISGLSNLEQWISESVDSIACGTESE